MCCTTHIKRGRLATNDSDLVGLQWRHCLLDGGSHLLQVGPFLRKFLQQKKEREREREREKEREKREKGLKGEMAQKAIGSRASED